NFASYQQDPTENDGNGFIVDTANYPTILRNNIAYRNHGTGISFTLTDGNTAVNNTLVENGYQSTSPNNGAGLRWNSSKNNTVINNIFADNRACSVHGAGNMTQQKFNYNIYKPGVPALHDSYTAGQRVYNSVSNIVSTFAQEKN